MKRTNIYQMLLSLGLAAAGLSGVAFAEDGKVTTLKEPPAAVTSDNAKADEEQKAPVTKTPRKNDLQSSRNVVNVPDYWIGVQGGEVIPPLQAQLGLEENEGVLVEWVAPDSPAEKAGVKQYDVILKVNAAAVSNVGDIVKQVEQTKDKELTLSLIRKSKQEEIKLKPEKRPDNAKLPSLPQQQQRSFNSVHPGVIIEQIIPFGEDGESANTNIPNNVPEEFRQMIEQMQKQMQQQFQQQIPNMPENGKQGRLPNRLPNFSYNFSQDGNPNIFPFRGGNTTTMQITIEPAADGESDGTLTVKKNGQTWSVSQFSDLPENVQKDVAEMLKNSVGDKNVGDWIAEQMKSGRRLTFSVTISGNSATEDNKEKPEKKKEETVVKPET